MAQAPFKIDLVRDQRISSLSEKSMISIRVENQLDSNLLVTQIHHGKLPIAPVLVTNSLQADSQHQHLQTPRRALLLPKVFCLMKQTLH